MTTLTISIPEDLRQRAEQIAELVGVSLEEYARESLAIRVGLAKRPRTEDPLFDFDKAYDGPTPPDLAINHDKYLYETDDCSFSIRERFSLATPAGTSIANRPALSGRSWGRRVPLSSRATL